MIDLAPRLCDLGPGPKGRGLLGLHAASKRKQQQMYADSGLSTSTPCKRRRTTTAASNMSGAGGGTRLVDLQILGEDGALVQEATIEEIWAPHTTRLEIVVVDEAWDTSAMSSTSTSTSSLDADAAFFDLDDPVLGPLGPLGGTSTLHKAILREAHAEAHLQQHQAAPTPGLAASLPQAPRPQAEAADSDIGNLDWLINFKVDSVFEPKKQKGKPTAAPSPLTATSQGGAVADHTFVDTLTPASSPGAAPPGTPPAGAGTSPAMSAGAGTGTGTAAGAGRSASPKTAVPAAPAVTPSPGHHQTAHRYSGPGKPPFTYTELIELALKDKGKLTVKEIYQWITKHFPFYQASDERWKNSVRHNLSINPHFRKESKAPQGAGHLWVVMDNNNKVKNSWKEERIQNFLAAQISAAEAAESAACVARLEANEAQVQSPPSPVRPPTPPSPIPTGAKSHSQLNMWWSERVSLERSAEEILSGVKREVGVEFLTPMDLDGDLDSDDMKLDIKDDKGFLYGDLTAEQVIAESGLQDELAGLYLLNDMTSSMTPDSLFPDDLNFGGLELPLSG